MADAVASQTLFDGERLAIMKFTNISDGTGETKVSKVTPSSLTANSRGKACSAVTITKIWGTTFGMEVLLYWDATTDVFVTLLPPNTNYAMDYRDIGGLWNNAGAGSTGIIQFSTLDASLNDMYTITLEMVKTYA